MRQIINEVLAINMDRVEVIMPRFAVGKIPLDYSQSYLMVSDTGSFDLSDDWSLVTREVVCSSDWVVWNEHQVAINLPHVVSVRIEVDPGFERYFIRLTMASVHVTIELAGSVDPGLMPAFVDSFKQFGRVLLVQDIVRIAVRQLKPPPI